MTARRKKFLVKIYGQDGTTLVKNISTSSLGNIPNFTAKMNGIVGPCTFKLTGDGFRFDSFMEGTAIKHMNIVDVYVMEAANPLGRRIYRGFISKYSPFYRQNEQGVEITLLSIGALTSFAYYKNGSSFTVTHSTVDTEAIMRAIIDHANTVFSGSMLSYTADSTDPVGTNVSITYTDERHFDALEKAFATAGGEWWWKIDEIGKLYLKDKPATATHTFILGKHVDEIVGISDSEKVVNDVQVRGAGGGTSDDSDATSQATYGTGSPATGKRSSIVTATELGDANARTQRAAKEIADNKDAKVKTSITINDTYDLESIKPGETCKIRNLGIDNDFFSSNMQIVSVSYSGYKAVIEIGDEIANFASELDSFVNG